MARVITISGVDRTVDILIEGTRIEKVLTYREDACSFTVIGGTKPFGGEEVVITEDGVKKFAGIIDKPEEKPQGGSVYFYECQARDYTYQFDQLLVVEEYTNQAADVIAADIIAKYCSGFTGVNIQSGSPVIENIKFDYKHPSQCMKELSEYVGWDWYLDYDKDLHFFNAESLANPAPVIIGPDTAVSSLKHTPEIEGLKNRVYIRGGTMLSDDITYEYAADGKQRAWILPYRPHDLKISIAGGPLITPGIEDMDKNESLFQWMMNFQEKLARLALGQPNIIAGTTVSFTFKYDTPVITMVEDMASQAAVRAIQGGTGIYEHVIVDDSIVTLEAAEAAGNKYLLDHSNPSVKGSFDTEIDGWEPGQILTINLPLRGIVGYWVIQKVTMITKTSTDWTYRVEYGGRLIGLPDDLMALVSAQRNKKLADTSTLEKIAVVSEAVGISDVLINTLRTPPWFCGDSDAICGFVECA